MRMKIHVLSVVLLDINNARFQNLRMAVNAWKSLSNEDKIHHLEKTAKRKAKYEKLQKALIAPNLWGVMRYEDDAPSKEEARK
ncbi:hypothetical protein A2U01_0003496 [Trifolium medium]|uniref:Uncharacterized protein n=1 Tax=Trifolium medium TaxID=97028 RepID=A0A392M5S5_9FABA|nr:hypothetical protein [Trifolium medium]